MGDWAEAERVATAAPMVAVERPAESRETVADRGAAGCVEAGPREMAGLAAMEAQAKVALAAAEEA